MVWRWDIVARYYPYILAGVPITLLISIGGFLIALALGLLLALGRLSSRTWPRAAASVYITFFRGTPLLVQLFLIHYGLPQLFSYRPLSPLVDGIIILGLNASAYVAEVYRASINSVARGQMEAARSLGMTATTAMRLIVLPQALRIAVPPLFNEFIAVTKDSAQVFVLGVADLMTRANLAAGRSFRQPENYAMAAVLYLLLTMTFTLLSNWAERRFGRHEAA